MFIPAFIRYHHPRPSSPYQSDVSQSAPSSPGSCYEKLPLVQYAAAAVFEDDAFTTEEDEYDRVIDLPRRPWASNFIVTSPARRQSDSLPRPVRQFHAQGAFRRSHHNNNGRRHHNQQFETIQENQLYHQREQDLLALLRKLGLEVRICLDIVYWVFL